MVANDERASGDRMRLSSASRCLLSACGRTDAIGSALGIILALQAAGKPVRWRSPMGFFSLPASAADLIKTSFEPGFDTFITVDCADYRRTGKLFAEIGPPDINIDHHITNEKFGKLNLIEGDEVATSAILTNHLPGWGFRYHAHRRRAAHRHHHRHPGFPDLQRHPRGHAPGCDIDGIRR
jgi:hypothetical protein